MRDRLDPQEPRGLQVHRDPMVNLVFKGHLELKDHRVLQDRKDHQAL